MKRQDKFARFFITMLFVVTIAITGFLCVMPLVHAKVPRDSLKVTATTSTPQSITISGEVNNRTMFPLTEIEIVLNVGDDYGFTTEQVFKIAVDVAPGETATFTKTVLSSAPDTIKISKNLGIKNVSYEYQKFPYYVVFITGLILTILAKNLFGKRKYYFDIDDKKVVVFASWKKAGVIVDGVLIKEGKLPTFRQEVALFNMKIAGHFFKFYSLNGDIVPSIRALVDDKPVKYTKVRQNPFVKMMDEGVVRGSGDITMRSKYETDGEAAEKYNAERWAKDIEKSIVVTEKAEDKEPTATKLAAQVTPVIVTAEMLNELDRAAEAKAMEEKQKEVNTFETPVVNETEIVEPTQNAITEEVLPEQTVNTESVEPAVESPVVPTFVKPEIVKAPTFTKPEIHTEPVKTDIYCEYCGTLNNINNEVCISCNAKIEK